MKHDQCEETKVLMVCQGRLCAMLQRCLAR